MDLLCRVHTQRRTPLTSPRSESYVTVGGRSVGRSEARKEKEREKAATKREKERLEGEGE